MKSAAKTKATIIITRPEPDASNFAAMIAPASVFRVISPVMRISILPEAPNLEGAAALAFTSANGVRAFAAVNPEPSLPVFAVGQASAAAAREAGFEQVTTAQGDVASLATAIIANHRPSAGAILHIAGAVQAGDLAGALTRSGLQARTSILYRADPVPEMTAEAIDALRAADTETCVVFFSPRGVRLFFDQARKAELTDILLGASALCLSEAVAKEAQGGRWRDVAYVDDQTSLAMARYINQNI